MSVALEGIGGVLVVAGALFMVVGALGLLRMPDVFTRLHAASVADSFGLPLVLVGLMVYGGLTLVTVKLFFLFAFAALTGPAATHAVARAARFDGVRPRGADGMPLAEPGEETPSKR